jgi:uncharacterized protein
VHDVDIDARRFRSNLIVDTADCLPWVERKWLGRDLRVGDGTDACVLRVDRNTTRCEVVNLDPETGQATHDLFEAIRNENLNRAGVYATPAHVGTLAVGATVYIR